MIDVYKLRDAMRTLTHSEIARRLKCSQPNVSHSAKDPMKWSLNKYVRICRVMGRDPKEFLEK